MQLKKMKGPSARSTVMILMTLARRLPCLPLTELVPVARRCQSTLLTISPLLSGCLDSTIDHATQLNLVHLNSPWFISTQHLNSTWRRNLDPPSGSTTAQPEERGSAQRHSSAHPAQRYSCKGTAGRIRHTSQTTNHNHKPQTTNHKPRTTNHKPRTTDHNSHTTTHKPHAVHFLILPHP